MLIFPKITVSKRCLKLCSLFSFSLFRQNKFESLTEAGYFARGSGYLRILLHRVDMARSWACRLQYISEPPTHKKQQNSSEVTHGYFIKIRKTLFTRWSRCTRLLLHRIDWKASVNHRQQGKVGFGTVPIRKLGGSKKFSCVGLLTVVGRSYCYWNMRITQHKT